MRVRITILAALLFVSVLGFGQKIIKQEGVYVNAETLKEYTGVYISYFDNGEKEAVYSVKKGVEDGKVEFYYFSGEIMEQGAFENGEKSGKWVRWSQAGIKLAEAFYSKGEKDGEWQIWDERGVKRYLMNYVQGKKTGTWIMWDEKGQISNKKDY
jgi:antitoxin component YwqK of YwqJK toxin-antitoxin module